MAYRPLSSAPRGTHTSEAGSSSSTRPLSDSHRPHSLLYAASAPCTVTCGEVDEGKGRGERWRDGERVVKEDQGAARSSCCRPQSGTHTAAQAALLTQHRSPSPLLALGRTPSMVPQTPGTRRSGLLAGAGAGSPPPPDQGQGSQLQDMAVAPTGGAALDRSRRGPWQAWGALRSEGRNGAARTGVGGRLAAGFKDGSNRKRGCNAWRAVSALARTLHSWIQPAQKSSRSFLIAAPGILCCWHGSVSAPAQSLSCSELVAQPVACDEAR